MLGWLLWLFVRIVVAVVFLIAAVFVASLSPSPGRCPSCDSLLNEGGERFWESGGGGNYCTVCGWHSNDR